MWCLFLQWYYCTLTKRKKITNNWNVFEKASHKRKWRRNKRKKIATALAAKRKFYWHRRFEKSKETKAIPPKPNALAQRKLSMLCFRGTKRAHQQKSIRSYRFEASEFALNFQWCYLFFFSFVHHSCVYVYTAAANTN